MSKVEAPQDWFASYTETMDASRKALLDAQQCATPLLAAKVTTPEQLQWAATVGKQVAGVRRQVEQRRDRAAKPWYQAYKAIREQAAEAVAILAQIERHLQDEVRAYNQRLADEQARALQAAATPAEIQRTVAAIAPAPTGVHERERWEWGMADGGPPPANLLAAQQRGLAIPAEYWILDEKKISANVREKKDATQIPGVVPAQRNTVVFK